MPPTSASASSDHWRRYSTRSRMPASSRLRWNDWLSASASASLPTISSGPRSVPAWGSMAITVTPSGTALANTMVDRPW